MEDGDSKDRGVVALASRGSRSSTSTAVGHVVT